MKRFWDKVNKTDTCWLWTGTVDLDGYGRIMIKRKYWVASRLSWVLHFGDVPNGMSVLHHCDNPSCVNPAHLFLGTNLDNVADMVSKNRQKAPKGEDHGRAKLTDNDVQLIHELHRHGFTQVYLGQIFKVSSQHINKIVNHKMWKHIPEFRLPTLAFTPPERID